MATDAVLDVIDELLGKPCWVVDLLPEQVPAGGAGQFFVVERWYFEEPRRSELRRRFVDVLLGLNCYYDFLVVRDGDEVGARNPSPEELAGWVLADQGLLDIILPGEDALVEVPDDSTCLAVYNPTPRLLELVGKLAGAHGLFVWQPPQEG